MTWASNQAFFGHDIGQLGRVDELEGGADLDQAADDLDGVHPVAAARHLRDQARRERQQQERKREHGGEGRQPDDRIEEIAAGRHHQQPADDRKGAGERRDRERERHEEHADQAASAFVVRRGVQEEARQTQLEETQQAEAEHDEEAGDEQVQPGVVGQASGASSPRRRTRRARPRP